MTKVDLTNMIVPVKLPNNFPEKDSFSESLNTTDFVFLESAIRAEPLHKSFKAKPPTAYAKANSLYNYELEGVMNSKCWLRSAGWERYADVINIFGDIGCSPVDHNYYLNISPTICLDKEAFVSAKSKFKDFGKIMKLRVPDYEDCIEFGEYPQTEASNSDQLESLFQSGSLKKTGKVWSGYMDQDTLEIAQHEEFIFEGEKYVRVKTNRKHDFLRPIRAYTRERPRPEIMWFKVEPLIWAIFSDGVFFPNDRDCINMFEPYIELHPIKPIMGGIPFYHCVEINHSTSFPKNCELWQNSTIRNFLNGYGPEEIATNGNPEYAAPYVGDFKGRGFLQQAFTDIELEPYPTIKENETPSSEPEGM